MSMELVNLMCRVTIAVSTLFIAIYLNKIQIYLNKIYLNKIQENMEFIRRNLYSIKDELRHQDCIREIVMKLDHIANTLDILDKEGGENI